MAAFSVLDLSPIVEGSDASQALRNTLDLAQHAERWGYLRFWLAEHHGMPGIASAATSIVIAHVAGGTTTIRVGAGGIMLPNHSPLLIAEQFGTLESLFPGRIDLGLGRAPGSDPLATRALRRNLSSDAADRFPQDVLELMAYFRADDAESGVRAVPGAGLNVPIWILGSSLFGAQLAAQLGAGYAFASHFAPAHMMEAIALYRREFRASEQLERPYVILGFNVIAADADDEARVLFTSLQQAFVNLRRGRPGRMPPPIAGFEKHLTAAEQATLNHVLFCTAIGSARTVADAIDAFMTRTGADELMVTSQIFDHRARLRSYGILADVLGLKAVAARPSSRQHR